VCNELGVLYYQIGQFTTAAWWLKRAVAFLPIDRMMASWQPVLTNLGHVFRKLEMYEDAVSMFTSALGLAPRDAGTLSALAFTHHLAGNLTQAIEMYHVALAYNADCSLTQSLLKEALKDHCERCCQDDDPGLM
jgi:anaphase-promoting complex subunit 6